MEQSAIIPEPLSSPEYGLHCLSHLREENGEDSDHGVMTQEATAEVMDAPMPHEKECTAVTRKELPPLVAMPPTSKAAVTNSLSKQTYSRLGRNILFEAKPAVRIPPPTCSVHSDNMKVFKKYRDERERKQEGEGLLIQQSYARFYR